MVFSKAQDFFLCGFSIVKRYVSALVHLFSLMSFLDCSESDAYVEIEIYRTFIVD